MMSPRFCVQNECQSITPMNTRWTYSEAHEYSRIYKLALNYVLACQILDENICWFSLIFNLSLAPELVIFHFCININFWEVNMVVDIR